MQTSERIQAALMSPDVAEGAGRTQSDGKQQKSFAVTAAPLEASYNIFSLDMLPHK